MTQQHPVYLRREDSKIRRDLARLYALRFGGSEAARGRILAWAHEAPRLGLDRASIGVVSMRTGISQTTLKLIRDAKGIPPYRKHSVRRIDAYAEGVERARRLRAQEVAQ